MAESRNSDYDFAELPPDAQDELNEKQRNQAPDLRPAMELQAPFLEGSLMVGILLFLFTVMKHRFVSRIPSTSAWILTFWWVSGDKWHWPLFAHSVISIVLNNYDTLGPEVFEHFSANNITFGQLRFLEDRDLIEMGVSDPELRHRMLDDFQNYINEDR